MLSGRGVCRPGESIKVRKGMREVDIRSGKAGSAIMSHAAVLGGKPLAAVAAVGPGLGAD